MRAGGLSNGEGVSIEPKKGQLAEPPKTNLGTSVVRMVGVFVFFKDN